MPTSLPAVPSPAHLTRLSGTVSSPCFAWMGSPRPAPFSPPSPPSACCHGFCSMASQILFGCPTPRIRSSRPCPLRVHHAYHRAISNGQIQGIPIPVQGVSVHAWGLRPRRVCIRLAISAYTVLPSVDLKHVGTQNFVYISRLNTQPARTPVNASTSVLPLTPHDSGPM